MARGRIEPSLARTSSLWTMTPTHPARAVARISTGERRKRMKSRFAFGVARGPAYPRRTATFARQAVGAGGEVGPRHSSSATSAGSVTASASASSPTSSTSAFVNAAWAGPRRPAR